MSSFGSAYRVSIFGDAHGPLVGVTVEGMPMGFVPDLAALQRFLDRRAPGRSALSSPRREPDIPEFTAGLEYGAATGGPLTAVIRNTDVRPEDYVNLQSVPRPGHADYPAMVKLGGAYGSGGGAFSGRMTAPLCVAGGLALQLLARQGISVAARAERIGGETAEEKFPAVIAAARQAGDSVGGVIACRVSGLPVGLGGPLWEGLESRIACAVFGIPAVKGVEFGAGFAAAEVRGSENNDPFYLEGEAVKTRGNRCGGILGGMADGMPLEFRAAVKPTPSIAKAQESVDLAEGRPVKLSVAGRHDPCIVPRAVPCVEAAAACALLDALLETAAAPGLPGLRQRIDRADRALLRAFDERMDAASAIGAWKRENGAAVLDPVREAAKLEAVSAASRRPEAARRLYETLFALSRALQTGEGTP